MLAGKYMRGIANSPVGSAVAGGAAAAGLSALGNVGSDKPGERIAAEALGAGLLGGAVGAGLPGLAKYASKESAENRVGQALGLGIKSGAIPKEQIGTFATAGRSLVNASPGLGAGLAALGVTTAGGLGGQVGGGMANMMGIDPENYGSNNTMAARYSMQGMPPM
jgi:hypothetical protein